MANDSKKNSAVDSGMRGQMAAPRPTGGKAKELPGGVQSITVRRINNAYIVSCEFPYDGKKWKEAELNSFPTATEVGEYIEKKLGVKDGDDK